MLRTSLALLALNAPLLADTLTVPGDAFNLQGAIELAQPGDTIVIATLSEQNSDGIVVVDKPLTIRGAPLCNLDLRPGGLLANGPGSGRLVLENVVARYATPDFNGKPALEVNGFDEVVLVNCAISHNNVAASGLITDAFPGIELSGVDRLVLLDSEVLGGPAGADGCVASLGFYTNGRDGISAPGTDVLLVGSSVTGGRGGFLESTVLPCPSSLATWPGKAGNGVQAKSVTLVDSLVSGGNGAAWQSLVAGDCFFGTPSFAPCGTQPDGEPFVLTDGPASSGAALVVDVDAISLSAGGVQTLTLAAEPALAGSIYLVAGSFSGSAPGLPLGPFVLPVNAADAYFDYTVLNANGAVLGQTLGALGADGRAEATVNLTPALPPSLVGRTATHAFVVADAALAAVAVSNATTLEILP